MILFQPQLGYYAGMRVEGRAMFLKWSRSPRRKERNTSWTMHTTIHVGTLLHYHYYKKLHSLTEQKI